MLSCARPTMPGFSEIAGQLRGAIGGAWRLVLQNQSRRGQARRRELRPLYGFGRDSRRRRPRRRRGEHGQAPLSPGSVERRGHEARGRARAESESAPAVHVDDAAARGRSPHRLPAVEGRRRESARGGGARRWGRLLHAADRRPGLRAEKGRDAARGRRVSCVVAGLP